MKCAVIDVGSNTIRLSVYKAEGTSFKILFSEKVMAGIAGYVNEGALSKRGIMKICSALSEFKQRLENFEIDRFAVFATASLRNIINTHEAINHIYESTGYNVEVISGNEEAMLDYYGALHSIDAQSGSLIDIGGGSTEVVSFSMGAHNNALKALSFPLGSLNLFSRYVSKIFPKPSEQKKILREINSAINSVDINAFAKNSMICGVGGTARATLKLINSIYDFESSNRSFSSDQLDKLHKTLCANDETARNLILKNCPDRVHTIIPGLFILKILTNRLGGNRIIVSEYGVREGYLCHRILKTA
ncbi:MAG: phosphatase [Candidatus Gastranaerophilaceae bacterium]|nr:hypothetical protein [Christensenellales bacterium]